MEYSKGKIVEGKIIHVAEEYLLVKFLNKETGILHKSKMSPQPEGSLTDVYHRNQSILVSIDWITDKGYTLGRKDIENRYENQQRHEAKEIEKQKMAEERKRMQDLVEMNASQFERGAVYEAEVIRLSNQIARISINGIEGYIEKEELNWNENESVKESLFEGEIIRVVFLEYKDGKLLFGLKYLEEKPYDDDLYSLSTIDLLNRYEHTSSVFIAEAKNVKGLCLTNLYSEEGNLLVDPIKGNNIVIRFVQPTIEEGKFYKVQVELIKESKRRENNDLFSFYVSKAEEIANPYKADVEKAFSWHRSPESNSSLANILDTVGLEMYSSAERMFFELIQNADDASSKDGVVINIDRIDNYLIFTHNGFHFNYKDFRSLVSAAKSTKSSKEKTGYKGIGFKSVFTNSQQVFVHSGGYHFKFDKEEPLFDDFDKFYSLVNSFKSEEQLLQFVDDFKIQRDTFRGVKDIPWQLLPIWYDAIPEILKKSAFAKNQKVSFALNIKNQKVEDYVKAIEYLFDNPKFILFLRHTNRLDLKFVNKTISKDVKDGIVTIKNSFANKKTEVLIKRDFEDISVSNDAFANKDVGIVIREITNRQGETEKKFYDTNNQELEDIPDRIASSQTTTISFVANYDNGSITENKGNSLYAYLPMNEHRFRFPFFINADFVLAANRETLLDNPWNYYLLSNIGVLLVKWVAELALKGENNCLKLLPLQYFDDSTLDIEQLAQSFNSAYRTALESEAFILNHKGEIARQDEIIIDKTKLSEIVGVDHFCQLLGTEKSLPSEKIDSKILEEDIFEYIEAMKFEDVIEAITDNSDFNDWYISTSDEQKTALYKWIEYNNIRTREDNLKSFVSNLPLFQFGEDYKSCEEFDSSEHIITTEHISPIRDVLSKLGFICSDNVFNNSHPLFEYVELTDEEDLFISIKERDFSDLSTDERKTLFFALADFDGVGDVKLKEIALFKNMNGEFKPLGEMVAYRENVPVWLTDYVLCKEDNSADLADYLIAQEDEFESIIRENINNIGTSWAELYQTYKEEWTGQFTRKIIDDYEVDNDVLAIIEESDINTKQYFLNSIEKLDLHSDSAYKKSFYEYRVLQLALEVYDEPSDFSSKIFFDGQCIKDFSIKDTVNCEYTSNGENKKVTLSLARLLPNYQDQSGQIEKVLNLFETKTGLEKFFDAKHKPTDELYRELNALLGIPHKMYDPWESGLGNAQQYLFSVYERKQCWTVLKGMQIHLEKESEAFTFELMDILFSNNIDIATSPFTYHLKKYFTDKFFNCDYVFDTECILGTVEKWANDDKKKKYLMDNGVRTEGCYAIQFRKLFLENKPIDFIDKLEDEEINSGIEFVATANGFDRPFVGENQKHVLFTLKDKCKDLSDNWDEEKMEEKSKEWDAKEYNEWIEDHYPQIFIYPGILPSKLSYKDELLLNYEDSDYNYYYNKDKRQLFVTSTKKIEDILFEVAKEDKSNLDIDDYKFLCWDGKVSLTNEEKDDYDNLKEEKDKIKLALQKRGLNYDDLLKGDGSNEGIIIQEPIEGANAIFEEKSGQHTSEIINAESAINVLKEHGFEVYKPSHNLTRAQENYNNTYQGNLYTRDGVPIKDQIVIHKEAMSAAKKYLESKNFDFSKSDYERSSDEFDKYQKWRSACQIHNVFQKSDGKSVTVVVKSCKGGHVYLSATDFQALTENKDNILILYDNNGCHSVSYNDLFKGSDVNLIFDPEYTPEHYYAALGKIFTYIKRSTFAVKNPNFNVYDTIKSFGMDSKTEGIQDLFDDNDL